MKPIRILVDSFADDVLLNAQMGNAREIVARLDPERFYVSMFTVGRPDRRIVERPNTRLIRLPARRQTPKILSEFLWGTHSILFYLKASPASRWYLSMRQRWRDRRTTIGTVESQSDLRNEPTIVPRAIRLWEQTVLRCDRLFSNSKCVQGSLQREYGLQSEIIPTGVDTRFFNPDWERPPNDRARVLFAGSLRPFKGPQTVLDAAARFPQADFRLAGDGIMAPELEARIKREALTNVSLLGAITKDELRREYRQADIFLFPSKWEGSPKVILEAAASGLPVIVRNSYAPETVLHAVTGFQVASDPELLSSVATLIANRELRERFGHAGRDLSKKFDWDLITANWEDAFISLAEPNLLRSAS